MDIWQVRAQRAKWALKKRIIIESLQAIKDPHRTFDAAAAVAQLEEVGEKIARLQLDLLEASK